MKAGGVKLLAATVIVLFGVLYALNTADRSPPADANELLVPELKARLNDLETVSITDANGELTLVREEGAWRVRNKGGYPADTATLRQVLLAIADARKAERKTANPDLYDRLGVQNPAEDGGDGVLLEASGSEFGFSLILGDSAQGEYRYARLPADAQSWLIDKNPDLPDDMAGWLDAQIVDLAAPGVQSVTIRHDDGETIRIAKETAEAGTFSVEGIPEGRELSYPTVVNSIAGALASLSLEDVAQLDATRFTPTTTATFTTFDGLQVEVTAAEIDEATWIALEAAALPADEPAAATAEPGTATDDGGAADATGDGGEATADPEAGAAPEAVEAPDAAEPTPVEKAAEINARTQGWRYRIATYKADQLTRRWEDILAAEAEE